MIVIYMRDENKKKLRRELKAALAREAAMREGLEYIVAYSFGWKKTSPAIHMGEVALNTLEGKPWPKIKI